jgi:hypothetical protein
MDLKPIDRTDRGKARLHAAMTLYRDLIRPDEQNPEQQILYWIEHSREVLADQFRCFAIQSKGEVVGYLQYSYFNEEHLFFFEYFCMRSRGRVGLLTNPAVKAVRDYLTENYRPGFTIVFECAREPGPNGQWLADKRRIDYFQRLGFRTLDFNYSYPVLTSYDKQESFPADLMVLLPEGRTTVSATQLRSILRCVYFKHYLRWDRPFLEAATFEQRARFIETLYSRTTATIHDDDSFDTKGAAKKQFIWAHTGPSIKQLLHHLFGPKYPRLVAVFALLLVVQWLLGSVVYLIPFVIAAAAVYCLAEDTETAEKLFREILRKFTLGRTRA